jgi:hypothetical protein
VPWPGLRGLDDAEALAVGHDRVGSPRTSDKLLGSSLQPVWRDADECLSRTLCELLRDDVAFEPEKASEGG